MNNLHGEESPMFNFLKSVGRLQIAGSPASSTPGKERFSCFSKNDPDLAHRDEVAGGAVGVQHLDGLAEGDVAHCERSRKAGRRPDPVVVVMQVFLKSGLDCSPQLCLDIVERLSNIVDVLVCLGHKIDVKRMSHYLVVVLCH